ncbi:uncharacterized protein [Diadema setosum]|uniref:uncharacterized protein n=1 Tax=Diadema setosum TaxID=31175 RepID=UPI003B3A03BE
MLSLNIFLLCLLVTITSFAEATKGQVSTKLFVTAYFGRSVELPCEISRPPYTVFWYQHISSGAPDEASRIVVQNINGEDIATTEPRFEITSDFSLMIHNVTVQDETTYSCRVGWFDDQMTRYTQLRVVALADELNPITVENCRKNGTDKCMYIIDPSEPTIQLKCEVVGVRPAVKLTWTDALTGEMLRSGKTNERVDTKTGLVTVFRVTAISGLDINQDRMILCQAKGEAVRGTSRLTVLLHKEPEEDSNLPGGSSTPVVMATVLTLIFVGLIVTVVLGFILIRKKKRKKIRDYRPGVFSPRYIAGDVQLPSQVKISFIAPLGAGKSSFIRSLVYALSGNFIDTIEVAGEMSTGGVTLETTPYKLTDFIIVEDNKGLKDLGAKQADVLFQFFRSHPVLVLTHRDDAEAEGKKVSIMDEAKAVGALDQKLFFVENFTERLDEDDPKLEVRTLEFLNVFLKLLDFADDNLVRHASGAVSSPEANTEGGDGMQQKPGRFKDFFKRKLNL